jgi:hypothetical protein
MSLSQTEQDKINEAQAALDKRRADESARLTAQQRQLADAVQARIASVPMHGTNIGETALVVVAVLDVLGVKYDPGQPAQPAAASQR